MVSPISNHRSFCRVVHDDSTKTSAIFVWPSSPRYASTIPATDREAASMQPSRAAWRHHWPEQPSARRDIPLASGNLATLYSRPNDGSNPWIRILAYVATKGLTGVSAAKRWFKSGQTMVHVTGFQAAPRLRRNSATAA